MSSILTATLEELAGAGYQAFSVEDVARRAGVNKTTVYRRWPTKPDLVRAALASASLQEDPVPDTGSLRGDLVWVARSFFEFATRVSGRSLFRIAALESVDSEFQGLADDLRRLKREHTAPVIQRAVERGEIAERVDGELAVLSLLGVIHFKLFCLNERVDDVFIMQVVDLLVRAAKRDDE